MTVGGSSADKQKWLNPRLYGLLIPYKKTTKFLGLIIDDHMSFVEEVKRLKEKATIGDPEKRTNKNATCRQSKPECNNFS